jgi:predicted metal-dependent hydrolase
MYMRKTMLHYLFFMQKIIEDKELGKIVLRKYLRSRAYTIRLKQGKISVSMPFFGNYRTALELLEKHRKDLLLKQQAFLANKKPEADESQLRKQAKACLPERLHALAAQYGFTYTSLKINKSKGRWGSCSMKKSINLSLFLMTLPPHLIDYVILHELCHTQVMNHSPEFWKLMDEVTGGKAKSLRKELRDYTKTAHG